jgi:4-amino-4-deoxy-L-arabinose transferase-like glycosyltransferase
MSVFFIADYSEVLFMKRYLLIPLLLVLFALSLRWLAPYAFWFDEVLTLQMIGGGYYDRISLFTVPSYVLNFHDWPPLGYMLLWVWGNIAGWTEFVGRYVAVLMGMLTVAMLYRLAVDFVRLDRILHTRINPQLFGLFSAFMFGTTAFMFYYWHEMRPHIFYIFFSMVGVWAYWRCLYSYKAKRFNYALLFFSLTALIYTHYIGSLVCGAIGLYHLWQARKSPHRRKNFEIFMVLIAVVLAFLPWAIFLVRGIGSEAGLQRGLPLDIVLSNFAIQYTNGLPLLMLGLIILAFRIPKTKSVRFIWLWLIVFGVGIFVLNTRLNFLFHLRHLLGWFIPLVLVMGLGLSVLWNTQRTRVLAIIGLALWGGFGLFYSLNQNFMSAFPLHTPYLTIDFVQTLDKVANECANSNDSLVLYTQREELRFTDELVYYYYTQNTPLRYAQLHSMSLIQQNLTSTIKVNSPDTWQERLNQMIADAPSVWYFELKNLPEIPQQADFLNTMQATYSNNITILDTPEYRITQFSNAPTDCVITPKDNS